MELEIFLNTCHDMVVVMCCALFGYGAYLCLLSSHRGEVKTADAAGASNAVTAAPLTIPEEQQGRFATALLVSRMKE